MSRPDPNLQDAARAVRPYLAKLVDDPDTVDDRLVELLRQEPSPNSDAGLTAVFDEVGLVDWVASFLQNGVPPEAWRDPERGLSLLPGTGAPISADRFVCPVDGNYVFYRRMIGQPVPKCLDDGARLVLSP
jgi:hypothetical protein